MEWETSDVIALVAAIGTILAVLVTGVSIWFNYRQSGRRLKHETKLQAERLADQRRREGLPLAGKAYRLARDVHRKYELSLVEKRAGEVDAFGMGSDAKQAVREAVSALELVTVAGSDIMIQLMADLALVRVSELHNASFLMIGAIQRNDADRGGVSESYQQTWGELGEALDVFARAIRDSPVTHDD